MRASPPRTTLNVTLHGATWCVELEGKEFGHTSDKEEAKAAANRRAREIQDSGKLCQVRVRGEVGYFS